MVISTSTDQGVLFDGGRYYDRAVDPDQAWNLVPGLDEGLVSDDDLHDWGMPGPVPGVEVAADWAVEVGGWSR